MKIDDVFEKLRNLHEPPPKPQRLPTIEEVNEIEKALGIKLHPDFKRYLLEVSDVCVGFLEPVTITLPNAHTDLLEITKDARQLGISHEFIPICCDNGDFFLVAPNGEVSYWSHDGPVDRSWPDIASWVKEEWLEEYE